MVMGRRLADDEVVSLIRRPLLTPQQRFLVFISVAAERIEPIEKCGYLTGNRARDLPSCNILFNVMTYFCV
jgi:hypothetical protein